MNLRRRSERVDQRRIHELEYELGFRDDPPPPEIRVGPGVMNPVGSYWQEELAIQQDIARVAGVHEVNVGWRWHKESAEWRLEP